MKQKKKCLNCLCMSELDAKFCNFCKTPFREGRAASEPITPFMPPVVVIQEVRPISFHRSDSEKIHSEESDVNLISENEIQINNEPVSIISEVPSEVSPVIIDSASDSETKEFVLISDKTIPPPVDTSQNDLPEDKPVLAFEAKIEVLPLKEHISVSEESYNKQLKDTFDIRLDALGYVEEEIDFKELKKRVPETLDRSKLYRKPPEVEPVLQENDSELLPADKEPKKEAEPEKLPEIIILPPPVDKKEIKEILKDRCKSFAANLSESNPFARIPFEIDSLELAEIKNAEEKPVYEEGKAEEIDVNPDSLKEINELARMLLPDVESSAEDKKTDVKEDFFDRFSSKDIIRMSGKEIIEQKTPEPYSQNIRDAIDALEGVNSIHEENISSIDFFNSQSEIEQISVKKGELKTDISPTTPVSGDIFDETQESDAKKILNDRLRQRAKKFAPEEKSHEKEPEVHSTQQTNTHTSNVTWTGARGSVNSFAMEHYQVAKDFCVKGEYSEALIELEMAVTIDPAFEQAHILLSRTFLKLKKSGKIFSE